MVSRILLADDSITIQKVVNLTFADEGIEVVAVSNGEMAARRMDDVNPDLVLADIFMPGKNGYELCETIKTNPKFRNVPVVLLVGAFEPFDQAEAKRVLADAHLTKPFESRTLVDTVRKLLGSAARPAPPLPSAPQTSPEQNPIPFGLDDFERVDTPALSEPEPSIAAAEQDTWPEQTPIDSTVSVNFEASAAEWVPVDAPPNEAAGSSNGETRPLDLGQLPVADALPFQTIGIQSASDEVALEVPFWERPTGELVSPPGYTQSSAPTAQPEVHEPSEVSMVSSFEVPANVMSDQPVEPARLEVEAPAWTSESSSPSEFQQQEMVVDFEESLPSTSVEASDAEMLDATAQNAQNVDLDNEQPRDSNKWYVEEVEQAANEWRAAHARNLTTTTLEMPESSVPSMETPAEAADVFSFAEAPAEAADVLSFAEAPAAGDSSSLFTAEEPLGDVLFDEATEPTSASSEPASPLDAPEAEFSLELPPEETASVEQIPEAPRRTRATGELLTAELPLEGQKLVEAAGYDFVAREVVEQPSDSTEAPQYELSTAGSAEPVGEEPSPSGSVGYDWTSPGAVVHSTGRLDSTTMPVEFAEVTEDSILESETEQAPAVETAVEQPVNWESEQMRFAAIDIEASPLEESDYSGQEFDSTDPERGFEISRALVDDQAADSHENGHRQTLDMPVPAVELSPMVIDEIVRRVVAQIGDSIVREIAWEIVPDCVERIIEQQTRDALTKR